MRYRDPQLRSLLAGEYVLGTLRGGARRRFEQLIEQDPVLSGEVENWEALLAPLAESIPDRAPPERVWQQIQRRVAGSADRPVAGIWNSLRFWRMGGLVATTCALLMAALLAVQLSREPEIRYVAVIADSHQRSAWLVSSMPKRGAIEVRTLQPQALAGDRSFELWLLPTGGGSPRSLGLLGSDSDSALPVPLPILESLQKGLGLAVSLEPRGGSPTGRPTGPVLYQGRLVRL